MIFDTHLHIVDRGRLRYPWLSDVPALDRDWSFADYMATAARLGISDVLHMEVDVAPEDIEAETAMVAALMALPGSPLRGAQRERRNRALRQGNQRGLHIDQPFLKGAVVQRHGKDDLSVAVGHGSHLP